MKIIAGLGNPGDKYVGTRHNIGYDVVDRIALDYKIDIHERKFKGLVGSGYIEGEKVVLVKPLTYMNLSGECIREVTDFYKIDVNEDLLIICDDINLEKGQLRLREKGSAGGHNGLKSIIAHVGDGFKRIRFGVGDRDGRIDLADHVLGHIPKEDWDIIKEGVLGAEGAVKCWITADFATAQNQYNRKKNG
ncbi:MAG: aminoacyl-tRNA hydrolase [Lachnospiraceae bacterium]|nr:aminoacyl-tRNA hydrolase [Lachnospiraceae bacterium]